ncbi:alpha/beta hydrolase fold domain-containing protein [Streptomyces sp. NPDC047981]|uniref:alpha/beta hydrolase n=1 Tax=Streptomyces sp. NPDC047981 TaxID=3154610 RepID=UPI003419BE08
MLLPDRPAAADRTSGGAGPGQQGALVVTAEADVVRDEAEQYARRLQQAGVAVTAVRYLGTVHDFASLNALRDSPPTKAAVRQGGAFLKAALTAGQRERGTEPPQHPGPRTSSTLSPTHGRWRRPDSARSRVGEVLVVP